MSLNGMLDQPKHMRKLLVPALNVDARTAQFIPENAEYRKKTRPLIAK